MKKHFPSPNPLPGGEGFLLLFTMFSKKENRPCQRQGGLLNYVVA